MAQSIALQEAEEFREFKKWLEDNRGSTIRIMVSGKKGVGKSSLLNVVFGTEFKVGNSLEIGTTEVSSRCTVKNGINLQLFDCPGLEDGDKNDKKNLRDIAERCTNIDLAIFCISMIVPRSNLKKDASALSSMTKVLGVGLWENAIICLTFANIYERRIRTRDPQLSEQEVRMKFEEHIQEWCRHLQIALEANNVPQDVISHLKKHVCVGGFRRPALPGVDHWVTEVWTHCINAMTETAKPLALQMDLDSFVEETDPEVEEYKTQQFTNPTQRRLILSPRVKKAMGVVATSGTTFAIGATIGALIGTFAIGLPTFGVAAGTGLAIGGVVGGGVGVGLSALHEYYKQWRQRREVIEM